MKQKRVHKNKANFGQADIQFLLAHLGMESHYLGSKDLESWDSYDWSNYKSLERRATTSIKQVFALYSDTVAEHDKYDVTSVPAKFFETREEAEALLTEKSKQTTHIYQLWVQNSLH